MSKSSLCDYSDEHILFKGIISVTRNTVGDAAGKNGNREVLFKRCPPFTDYIRGINKT